MTTLDLIFIGIIGLTAIVGGIKGLIKTVFGFASTIVSLLVAYMFYKPFAKILIKSTNIYYFLEEQIGETLNLNQGSETISSASERSSFFGNLQVPEFIQNMLVDNDTSEVYQLLGLDSGHSMNEYVSSFLANLAVNVLAFIILFVIVGLVIGIAAVILDLIAKLPVLKEVNHIAGFAIGLALGVLLLWIISLGLYFTMSVQASGELQAMIDESVIVPIFYNNNLLLNFLTEVTNGFIT